MINSKENTKNCKIKSITDVLWNERNWNHWKSSIITIKYKMCKTKIRTKTNFNKQKTVKKKKKVDFILTMSIFTLNINGLNTPNKRQR